MAADPNIHDVKINEYEDNSAIILRQMLRFPGYCTKLVEVKVA